MSMISVLVEKLRELENDPEIDCYGINELNNVCAQAADTIETLSAKLAAVNGGGWISCEDRLPEDGVDVLVWFEYFRYGEYNRLFQTKGISYTFNGKWSGFVNGSSGWMELRIIAWQPMPEDFRP